ncbi:hypothetical protein LXL04_038013 [Taraxacum kok-saghyz]
MLEELDSGGNQPDFVVDLNVTNFDAVLKNTSAPFAVVEFFTHGSRCRVYTSRYGKVARLFNGVDAVHPGIILVTRVDCAYKWLIVAVESAGRTLPMGFLERVKDEFNKKYGGGNASTAAAKSLSKSFGPKMKDEMSYCVAHPEEIDKIAKVKAQVDEVKGVMMDNIEKKRLNCWWIIDGNFEARVSDFGLAKLLEDEESHITTIVAGTFGYLAPEYMQSGRATEKTDVYSFGVLMLEVVSRKRPTDASFIEKGLNIIGWLNYLVTEERQREIVDEKCMSEGVGPETMDALLAVTNLELPYTNDSHFRNNGLESRHNGE